MPSLTTPDNIVFSYFILILLFVTVKSKKCTNFNWHWSRNPETTVV